LITSVGVPIDDLVIVDVGGDVDGDGDGDGGKSPGLGR